MIYKVMTPGGMHCCDIEAQNDEEAQAEAEKQLYEVLDVAEVGDEIWLVVA